ncbi:MAG: carbohydrate kinase family protein [Lachnospiraceae bacterium]
MKNRFDVVTSGYVSMDHIIRIATPAQIGFTSLVTNKNNTKVFPGGCSVNIAYALCKLGFCALPVLRVGNDYETNGLKSFLEKGKVPTQGIQKIEKEATSTCYLLQDNNNDHITVFYPGAMNGIYATKLEDSLFEDTRLGVITVAAKEDNEEFFRQCKKHQVPIAFGMKADFDAFPKKFLKELLLYSKIIFTNEVERKMLEELYEMRDITELFEQGNAEMIITTLGKEGSMCYEKTVNGIIGNHISGCSVEQVVDATGSGDAYIAGFLYGYLSGKEGNECGKLGSALSYFVLQQEGCCTNIPSEETLLKKYNEL